MNNSFTDIFFEEMVQRMLPRFEEMLEAKLSARNPVYPELVSVKVAAEITGYSINSLYQMKHSGKIPEDCYVKIGGKLMFKSKALQEWVRSGGTPKNS